MPPSKQQKKSVPFGHDRKIAELDSVIQERIAQNAQTLRNNVIPATNVQRLKHGRKWQATQSSEPDSMAETVLHTTETTISFRSIVDHDVRSLADFLVNIPNEMHKQFMRSMYEMVHDSTELTGNVVSGKDFKTSIKEALLKVKFGVDRWGVPSTPELHVGHDMAENIENLSREPDADYDESIRTLTEEKKKDALADECRRITRYRF